VLDIVGHVAFNLSLRTEKGVVNSKMQKYFYLLIEIKKQLFVLKFMITCHSCRFLKKTAIQMHVLKMKWEVFLIILTSP